MADCRYRCEDGFAMGRNTRTGGPVRVECPDCGPELRRLMRGGAERILAILRAAGATGHVNDARPPSSYYGGMLSAPDAAPETAASVHGVREPMHAIHAPVAYCVEPLPPAPPVLALPPPRRYGGGRG